MQVKPSKFKLWPRLLAGALAILFFSTPARAWWNGEWTLRKKITIDTTPTGAAIDGQIGTFPLLIRLHDGNFQFPAAKDDGSDLRFVAEDDKTLLPFHVEKYDSLLDEAFVWVKIPDLKPGAKTSFWLYYGNSGSRAIKADDPKGTYDADMVLVYHFSEHGQPAYDFTSSGNNAQAAGTPADGTIIGTGLRLDGHVTVTVPASPSLEWTDGAVLTWSAWIKPAGPQANAVIFSRTDAGRAFSVGVDNGIPFVDVTGATGTQRSPTGAALPPATWHHLAAVADGQKISLYVDGSPYAALSARIPALNSPAVIGGGADAATGTGFAGEIDELEISKTARSEGFLKLAAASQGATGADKLLAVGDAEQRRDWFSAIRTGYVGIIVSSLSADGWVVIGILFVMSAISWIVMLGKGSYLRRVVTGNTLFLKEWSHVAADLSVLDDNDADRAKTMGGRINGASQRTMHNAPLYKIYHVGVEEIRHRLAADTSEGSGRKGLSGRSIQAIRASLDGGLVREMQKLNNQMVLLTIAISGGPFLGLLGTVVGVMITFAAVAAAGDVNVNAIAPGIAAALAATVAGLAVAIPALFGYNYLLTRIKSVTSDMHVFIDEFVTRMAEFYRERERERVE
ncbi:MAG TPA: DUF2341 domain-containing protein [Opitutaceae bacterium]|nr:DUF2341 domain-containing protein [Opitutaceae bacterium]